MPNTEQQYFHFTLGPVQGFVAQARRTRDFWAGSFLLSWLAGVAMAEVQRQNGEIQFPIPESGYLDWITGKKKDGEPPRQGGIPNRFKAFSAKVPADFNGALVEATIREAWIALAEHIWHEDQLADVAAKDTRTIWDRQHGHFWEISWALSGDAQASSLLDQRKNWRSHYPQPEAGVKCMVMDGWQELSGATRPGQSSGERHSLLSQFWNTLREQELSGIKSDLAKQEHLCALAYVKRRFVRHFDSFETTLGSGLKLKGWKLQPGVPSVSYMAAVHWLEKLVQSATHGELQTLYAAAKAVNKDHSEWETRVACLQTAREQFADPELAGRFLALDGNLLFDHVLEHATAYDYDTQKVAGLQKALGDFKRLHADFDEPLSPFYAILLMDGDSLGKHMADAENQTPISTALNAFTSAVPRIVEGHNGFLIYAGGDDVLAILPLEDAMRCAAAVRESYLNCFKPYPKIPTTISAAIEFAHVKMPLGKILQDAHSLLDDVAKDDAGRDALAVRVWKPGGMTVEWAQPWEIALDPEGKLHIEKLVEEFRVQDQTGAGDFSNKFFYKIGERFELLNPAQKADGTFENRILQDDESLALVAVDFKNSGQNRDLSMEEARSKIGELLRQCRAVTREAGKAKEAWKTSELLKADGALLVRFLAQKGVKQ
ncbi:type III-B CRISPR-associated protein Cas10/Cmr2 [Chitinilyticum piscinae]|uniref:Type III-B CRISPR-associated protein Cas10/Cmr2 n=1 Tax=Chitinilyticum piscinae TaxID=2866724 RepID=A0A8J7FMN0_9NEIS|nr:type III-B CRISPR-associated protein Cas10/Cmr2 [Chitinilyticum piscinae]MBE9610827.1 type III-B CRISPR-associated protein Cas10/Cmr2 [Chitinilyticum piscinae]